MYHARMFANPRTAGAAGIGGLLLGIFTFIGPEPISWPRAAVLIAACFAIAAVGIFSHGPPVASQPLPGVTAPPGKVDPPEPDVPPTVGP